MDEQSLWEKCAAFHGHECGGLAIGFKAALLAAELLGLSFSQDEETVCISENDACGVDAIQVILGCSVGKGNLLFHMTGKQAFSFYRRATGQSVRLVLRPKPADLPRGQSLAYYRRTPPAELFDVKPTKLALPEEAAIFRPVVCERCGETAASNWIRLQDGKKVCIDCYRSYDRFHV
ncbi:MAG: formylmethanofuran dehydrogenase [Oscillospiraceae bacterium]|nr:formylmethanofuran dehydrogenase [Oscillospiraceae bacterium]